MKALVTGRSGFLGINVADALSEAGHDVVIFYLQYLGFVGEPTDDRWGCNQL